MQNCKFCGSLMPNGASFCGYCGRAIDDQTQRTMDVTLQSEGRGWTFDTPPLPNNLSQAIDMNAETEWKGRDDLARPRWTEEEMAQNSQGFSDFKRQVEENETALPDIMPFGTMMGGGQAPPAGHVPLVQGTPQVGGVPTVQGTPSMFTSPGTANVPNASWGGQAPPHQLTWNTPMHPPQSTPPPVQYPMQAPAHHPPPQTTPHRHHHHAPRAHTPRFLYSKRRKGIAFAVTATVVIVVAGILFLLANPAAISLSGNNAVTPGGVLHLHGKGFFPGGSVILTLDDSLPISATSRSEAGETMHSVDASRGFANTWQMLIAEQPIQQVTSNSNISVDTEGTFDVNIPVNPSWSPGLHTIHATEGFGSRNANLSFKILSLPKLAIQQKNLVAGSSDCPTITGSGNLIRGWLCTVTLSADTSDLKWSASSTNPTDRFTPSKGVVHPHHSESVTIFISNDPRCSNATFTFVGPVNTVSLSWSCPTK